MQVFYIYLLLVNATGFLFMLADKHKARRNLWRIPEEATLIFIAVIGGSLGTLGGMYAFRHKTLHLKFRLGVPLILAAQVLLWVWLGSMLI